MTKHATHFYLVAIFAAILAGAGWKYQSQESHWLTPAYNFDLAVAQGEVVGHTKERKFGDNPSVGTSYEAIWEVGGDAVWPIAAETLSVVSSDVDDDDGDTGARTILIQGLDADLAAVQEVVTMNGTSAVTTTNSYLRLNRAFVVTCGTSGGTNEGDIVITQSSSGDAMGRISAGLGQTQKALYTVPAGYTLYNTKIVYTTDSSKTVDFQVRIRALDSDTGSAPYTPWRQIAYVPGVSGIEVTGDGYTEIPAGTDIEFRAKASTGTATCAVSVQFYLVAD